VSNYVKLFGSILDSTIWKTPPAITKVWITMLAMADRDGVVEAALPGLASRANVALRTAESAIEMFLAPDPHSKTRTSEGRRIEVVPGGWRLLNYEAYREKQSIDDRKTKNAERQQRFRDRQAAKKLDESGDVTPVVTLRNAPLRSITPSDASCSALLSDLGSENPPARSNGDADLWAPYEWRNRYGKAWCARYRRIAYGDAGDTRGLTNLEAIFETLPASERLAAQADAPRMFAEFLARDGREAQRRHPFLFFVQEFGGLRVPAPPPVRAAAGPTYRKL
jgi:hypothetical protein